MNLNNHWHRGLVQWFCCLLVLPLTAQSSFLDRIPIANADRTCIETTPEAGLLVAYATKTDPAQFRFEELNLLSYDPCGLLVQARKFQVPNHYFNLVALQRSKSGAYHLMGYLFDEGEAQNIFLLKLNPDQTFNYFRVYSTPSNNYPYSLMETADGELTIFGMYRPLPNQGRNFFLRLDKEGNILTSKAYFKGGVWGRAMYCSDGGYLGRLGNTIYKINQAGDIVWSNSYNGIAASSNPLEMEDGYVWVSFKQGQGANPYFLYQLDKTTGAVNWTSSSFLGTGIPVLAAGKAGNLLCLYNAKEAAGGSESQLSLSVISPTGEILSHQALQQQEVFSSGLDFSCRADGSIAFSYLEGESKDNLVLGTTDIDFSTACPTEEIIATETAVEVTALVTATDVLTPDFTELNLNGNWEAIELEATRICEMPLPVPSELGNDTTLCYGESLRLEAASSGATYLWQDGATTSDYRVETAGTYRVQIQRCGESFERSIGVEYEDCPCAVEAPNIFTPNGDGRNDSFGVIAACAVIDFELNVYNRWGQLVFRTTDISARWQGTQHGQISPAGVYVYWYRYRQAQTADQAFIQRRGDLSLVR